MKHFAALFCPWCVCVCVFFCVFFFPFLLISNCLYNVCWKLAVMFSNSNHISNLWFPFRTDHGYLTRLAPAIFGWPWSSLFCNCVNLLYTIIIFNFWGLNKAVVVVVGGGRYPIPSVTTDSTLSQLCFASRGSKSPSFPLKNLVAAFSRLTVALFSFIKAPEILQFEPVGMPSDIW